VLGLCLSPSPRIGGSISGQKICEECDETAVPIMAAPQRNRKRHGFGLPIPSRASDTVILASVEGQTEEVLQMPRVPAGKVEILVNHIGHS
jgi:hypothetical protein